MILLSQEQQDIKEFFVQLAYEEEMNEFIDSIDPSMPSPGEMYEAKRRTEVCHKLDDYLS